MNSDERYMHEINRLEGERDFWKRKFDDFVASLPKSVHELRCHDCGNVALHADSRTPYVLCPKCGSQDTRKTKP